jgi:nucleotide-binding universal stress UspA family protein
METLLVPVDFSEAANNAALYAANLCRLFSSKLILFHAYHYPPASFEPGYIPPILDLKDESQDELKKMQSELKSHFPEVEVEILIEMGLAADMIEAMARQKNADLIVMGITGQDSFAREHIIGSVSTQVAQVSKIPVLIVPPQAKYSKVSKIAYACDFDKHLATNTTLIKVKYYCSLFNAELQILNVVKPEEEISVEKAQTDEYIEEKFKTTNHNTFFIYDKKVDKGLLEFIENHKVDMIITSPKKHNFFRDIFVESNTKKLAFHSPIPVLTIHE